MSRTDEAAKLGDAIDNLAEITKALRDDRRRERTDERYADPEFQAEIAAKRRPLRKMPFAAFVRAVPDLGAAFQTKVPSNFWSLMGAEEGRAARIDVLCPCGATPHPVDYPSPCPGAERNACPRWYLYDARDVRVAFSPPRGAPTPQPEEEAGAEG